MVSVSALPSPALALVRPVIADVRPTVDGGRHPAKAIVGETVAVSADVFASGHDALVCEVRHRYPEDRKWRSAPLSPSFDDRWYGAFEAERLGVVHFVVWATMDRLTTWWRALEAKVAAGQPVAVDLLVGAELVSSAAARAKGADRRRLLGVRAMLLAAAEAEPIGDGDAPGLAEGLSDSGLGELAARYAEPGPAATSPTYRLVVDPPRAGFSAWYELFPRSASPDPGRPGTLADAVERIPYLTGLGFDTLYLPPVHPVGRTNRKGRDGATVAGPDDPGSPWAIGGAAGGHTSIAPELGTLADFDRLVSAAAAAGIEVAMDLAFQCSPDHPWVTEHPDWFRHLPDGSIQFAENPPKRYEDIYPLDFDTPSWPDLWRALEDVVRFWIRHGVRVFRVDNPHTKPMVFWEWLLQTVKADHPDVVFLSEAFTRPRVMEHLAKVGFSQSYTYFTWRNTKWELEEYLTQVTRPPLADYFRPNLWPNTPDILAVSLQGGQRSAFVARLVLAATLSANYGIYGPPFELGEHVARAAGSEEYLHSEKYEVRYWDLGDPASLGPVIAKVNGVRRVHRALQQNRTLRFHPVDNDQLTAYSKTAPGDTVLVVVNLDPDHRQEGVVHLDLPVLGLRPDATYEVRDLLSGSTFEWRGAHNYVALDPVLPAHLFWLPGAGSELPVGAR